MERPLIELIDRVLCGSGSPDEVDAFTARMSSDPRFMKDVARHAMFLADLRVHGTWASAAEATGGDLRIDDPTARAMQAKAVQPRSRGDRRMRRFARIAAIAASVLVAGALVTAYVVRNPPATDKPADPGPAIATLIDATGNVLVNDSFANPGSEYAPGTYSIDAGSAEFLLTNQVVVNLKGTTRLVMHDSMHATLEHGSAVFLCPPGTVGYTVDLPGDIRVVDLGTRFGVRAEPSGKLAVSVLKGRVEVRSTGYDGRSRQDTVEAGMTWSVGPAEPVSMARTLMPLEPVRVRASDSEASFEESFDPSNLFERDLFAEATTADEFDSAAAPSAHTWATRSRQQGVTTASITIDLGRDYELAGLLLWNYNHAPQIAWLNGVERFAVTTATEAMGVASLDADPEAASTTYTARIATSGEAEPAQRFDLSPVRARYLRLHLLTNHGGDRFGISELRVLGRVLPSSVAILGDLPDAAPIPGASNTDSNKEPASDAVLER